MRSKAPSEPWSRAETLRSRGVLAEPPGNGHGRFSGWRAYGAVFERKLGTEAGAGRRATKNPVDGPLDPGNHGATIGMAAEHDLKKIFARHDGEHILDMGRRRDQHKCRYCILPGHCGSTAAGGICASVHQPAPWPATIAARSEPTSGPRSGQVRARHLDKVHDRSGAAAAVRGSSPSRDRDRWQCPRALRRTARGLK